MSCSGYVGPPVCSLLSRPPSEVEVRGRRCPRGCLLAGAACIALVVLPRMGLDIAVGEKRVAGTERRSDLMLERMLRGASGRGHGRRIPVSSRRFHAVKAVRRVLLDYHVR